MIGKDEVIGTIGGKGGGKWRGKRRGRSLGMGVVMTEIEMGEGMGGLMEVAGRRRGLGIETGREQRMKSGTCIGMMTKGGGDTMIKPRGADTIH